MSAWFALLLAERTDRLAPGVPRTTIAFIVSLKTSTILSPNASIVIDSCSPASIAFPVSSPVTWINSCPSSVAVSPATVFPNVLENVPMPAAKPRFSAASCRTFFLTSPNSLFLRASLNGPAINFVCPRVSSKPAKFPPTSPTRLAMSSSTPSVIRESLNIPPSTPDDCLNTSATMLYPAPAKALATVAWGPNIAPPAAALPPPIAPAANT